MISVDTSITGNVHYYYGFFPIFITERNTKFILRKLTLEISDNKDKIFFHTNSQIS